MQIITVAHFQITMNLPLGYIQKAFAQMQGTGRHSDNIHTYTHMIRDCRNNREEQ